MVNSCHPVMPLKLSALAFVNRRNVRWLVVLFGGINYLLWDKMNVLLILQMCLFTSARRQVLLCVKTYNRVSTNAIYTTLKKL